MVIRPVALMNRWDCQTSCLALPPVAGFGFCPLRPATGDLWYYFSYFWLEGDSQLPLFIEKSIRLHLKKWRPRLVPIDPFLSPTSPRLVVAVCLFPFRWWWYKETLFIIIKMMQISHNYIIIICLIVILTIIFIITMVAILIMTRAQISTRMIPTQDK